MLSSTQCDPIHRGSAGQQPEAEPLLPNSERRRFRYTGERNKGGTHQNQTKRLAAIAKRLALKRNSQ